MSGPIPPSKYQAPKKKKDKLPPVTEDTTVTGQRVVTVDSRRARVPLDDFTSGTAFINLPGKSFVEEYQAEKLYPDVEDAAKNWITRTPEGRQLAIVQEQLYLAGFYGNKAPIYGMRNLRDVSAMTDAMNAANLRGNTWEDLSELRAASNKTQGLSSAGTGSDGGGSAPTSTVQITGPNQARAKLKEMYLKYTDKQPDDSTFSKFYDALTSAQQKAPSRYEVKVINGKAYNVQVTDSIDVNSFTEQYVFNKINFSGGDLQGLAGENFTAAGKLAEMYDISLSTAERARYAKSITTGTSTANDIREELAKRAKIKFPGIADRIDSTVSTKDLLDEHLMAYANTLEIPLNKVKLSDVSGKAFKDNKLVSSNDMIESLKNDDPRYRNTKAAKNNATSFAIGLARTLGFGA